jgi:hypothetical protein
VRALDLLPRQAQEEHLHLDWKRRIDRCQLAVMSAEQTDGLVYLPHRLCAWQFGKTTGRRHASSNLRQILFSDSKSLTIR